MYRLADGFRRGTSVARRVHREFASPKIAAGPKALSTYTGNARISITLDRYGHLMPGSEEEAAGLLDDYLERADSTARIT